MSNLIPGNSGSSLVYLRVQVKTFIIDLHDVNLEMVILMRDRGFEPDFGHGNVSLYD